MDYAVPDGARLLRAKSRHIASRKQNSAVPHGTQLRTRPETHPVIDHRSWTIRRDCDRWRGFQPLRSWSPKSNKLANSRWKLEQSWWTWKWPGFIRSLVLTEGCQELQDPDGLPLSFATQTETSPVLLLLQSSVRYCYCGTVPSAIRQLQFGEREGHPSSREQEGRAGPPFVSAWSFFVGIDLS